MWKHGSVQTSVEQKMRKEQRRCQNNTLLLGNPIYFMISLVTTKKTHTVDKVPETQSQYAELQWKVCIGLYSLIDHDDLVLRSPNMWLTHTLCNTQWGLTIQISPCHSLSFSLSLTHTTHKHTYTHTHQCQPVSSSISPSHPLQFPKFNPRSNN